jgi:4-amino-4-deoxy-L-arabinose transferase-like glycosyltransferase
MKYQENTTALTRDLFFVTFSAFVLFFQLGRGSLATWDEATYGVIAREMVRSHHWLIPTYDGHVWLEKPPLCLWAIAFFYKCFGITEFSVRFFSALCGWGTVLVTYVFGAKLFNRWTGFLAGMFLLTAKHFTQHARLGYMDAPLVFFISLAFLFFWLGRERKGYFYLFGVALGLAFLTKGLAALVVIPVTWLYCAWAGELEILKKPSYWIGILIGLLIFIPWNAYAILSNASQYGADLHQQVFMRFTQSIDDHVGGPQFYFKVILNKFRPWVFLLIPALPLFIYKTMRTKSKEMILITVWALCVLALWTFVRTKLHWYILPVYPALSICIAWVCAKWVREKWMLPAAVIFMLTIAGHAMGNVFAANYSADLKGISSEVKRIVPEGKIVSLYNSADRSANFFYSERPTTSILSEQELVAAAKQNDFYCLIYKKDLEGLATPRADLRAPVRATSGELLLISKE